MNKTNLITAILKMTKRANLEKLSKEDLTIVYDTLLGIPLPNEEKAYKAYMVEVSAGRANDSKHQLAADNAAMLARSEGHNPGRAYAKAYMQSWRKEQRS